MSWFWCLDHKCVEQGFGCRGTNRLGPYETEAQAASALERVLKRKAEQEARDKADEKKPKPSGKSFLGNWVRT